MAGITSPRKAHAHLSIRFATHPHAPGGEGFCVRLEVMFVRPDVVRLQSHRASEAHERNVTVVTIWPRCRDLGEAMDLVGKVRTLEQPDHRRLHECRY